MTRTELDTDRSSAGHLLHQQVDAVSSIRLIGAPETLLLDAGALLTSEGSFPASLFAKLRMLTRHGGMHVVVLAEGRAMRELLRDIPDIVVVPSVRDAPLDGRSLAILADYASLPPHVYAWYVGPGSARPPFHGTRHTGARAADEILALFGTAKVQERAGLAFRAAGAGREIPREAPFDPKILDGVAAAVVDHPGRVKELSQRQTRLNECDLDRDTNRLIAAALPPILATQAPNGAVAAAPPPDAADEPNYWFFWQRDAGQVALTMDQLARSSADARVRDLARAFIGKYLDFVRRLPHHQPLEPSNLGVSRFDMNGKPIESYGNPQKDGPAHTVLAVVAALGASEQAYTASKPYLDYLSEHSFGPSFDPWEFAVGDVFFAFNLARRALRKGERLARARDDQPSAERYRSRANEIESFLLTFKQPEEGYILAGQNYLQPFLETISHLDIGVVGSALTAYDVDDPFLNVDDPLVVGTMKGLERVFAERWPVNVAWQRDGHAGMGMGRFPEDANDGIGSTGGNPWTFATLWASQYYLRLAQRRAFLRREDPGEHLRAGLLDRADGYLRFVLSHLSPEALTEQIDGQAGTPRGARKLSWAQAAFIETLMLRRDAKSKFFSHHRTDCRFRV